MATANLTVRNPAAADLLETAATLAVDVAAQMVVLRELGKGHSLERAAWARLFDLGWELERLVQAQALTDLALRLELESATVVARELTRDAARARPAATPQ